MNAIACVDNKMGIGKENSLLISIPEDMNFFKIMTTNKIVIMGRKTLESLPNQKPLKNRINIVITNDKNYKKENCIVFNNITDCIEYVKKYNEDDVFVIGGASIYKQFLPYCKRLYLTYVNEDFNADTFFPNIKNFKLEKTSSVKMYDNIQYTFKQYENIEYLNL